MVELRPRDQKVLWGLARNACAFPQCGRPLVEAQSDTVTGETFHTVIGEGAHIRSASPSGPRFDPAYPKTKLETAENRILLCGVHHRLIDSENGRAYSVDALLAMKTDHERQRARLAGLDRALRPYVADQFDADDLVLFKQVELHGPTVDAMFVDVPFACRAEAPAADLLSRIALQHPGDIPAVHGHVATGAAQALLHPDWAGNALLVGGPGQGKSTLLQYVTQFHRGRMLGREGYNGDAQGLRPLTDTIRVPIRLDLRRYAAWVAEKTNNIKKKKGKRDRDRADREGRDDWPSLEEYIAHHVFIHSGKLPFSVSDLATLVASTPVLLALDGLDEVADLADRDQVAAEVCRTSTRLQVDAANLTILVASRPGASDSAIWSSSQFPTFHLQKLTAGLRLQYLDRWFAVRTNLTQERAENLRQTFLKSENAPHIRDLAAYPMQLAILLHLLDRRGLLPQQRTELYRQYLETFLDREEDEQKEPLLFTERQLIVDVHSFLGWHLQTVAEQGDSSGKIARTALPRLLAEQLRGRERGQELAERLFNSVDSRMLCLVERETGFLEFEVQSLREYFAACYLDEYTGGRSARNARVDCFDAVLARPSWLNVCRFFVGMLGQMEARGIGQSLADLSAKPPLSLHPHLRNAAARLLEDRSLERQRDATIAELVEFILEGPGVVFAEDGFLDDGGQPLTFGVNAGRSQAAAHLKHRLLTELASASTVRQAVTAALQRHADQDETSRWWRSNFSPDAMWLVTAADLGVLADDAADEVPLASASQIATLDVNGWVCEVLASGGYHGAAEEVLGICHAELADGAADGLAAPGEGALGQLVQAARTAAGRPAGPRSVLPETLVQGRLATCLNPPPFPAETDIAGWARRLDWLADAWGDSWLSSQALAAAPARLRLDLVAAQVGNPALRELVEQERWAREHLDDLAGWRTALAVSDGDLGRRRWLYRALTRARAGIIIQLADDLDATAAVLQPRHYRSMDAALRASKGFSTARQLNLREDLRHGRVSFSPRLLWMLRAVGTTSTIEQADRLLADAAGELMSDRLVTLAEALTLKPTGAAPLELLQHAREMTGGYWSRLPNSAFPRFRVRPVRASWPARKSGRSRLSIEPHRSRWPTSPSSRP